MAECQLCKREMRTAVGCAVGKVHIDGKIYQRIKVGDVRDLVYPMQDGERCGDCGALKGHYDHLNCDVERCHACGRQQITCSCEDVYWDAKDIEGE